MVKKITSSKLNDNELYILPSSNDKMREFINKFKVDMMEHVVTSIKFAIDHKLPIVEVFQFANSPYVVTIAKKEFVTNLEHIRKYYKKNNIDELCNRIDELFKLMKHKPDEKENTDSN